MIFTDRFVYVHQPKTGGTFVTAVLFRLHEFRWTRWTHLRSALRVNLVHRGRYGTLVYNTHKHGGRGAIPPEQRHKRADFAPYVDLPSRAGSRFELALGSATAPRELLASHGWVIRDPREPTRDPWTYQRYIRESKGEWSVASTATSSRTAAGHCAAARDVAAAHFDSDVVPDELLQINRKPVILPTIQNRRDS